jgi:CHAD domain-containing protein
MGRNSKWIESQPGDSVEVVARRALSTRLGRLWHYLERSVHDSSEDAENVHQLRVFTRRTAVAMDTFDDWLPKRRGRWLRKQLKRLRKAAGDARDLDVLRIRWTKELESLPAGQSALLLEQVKRRRRKAQWPIEDAYHRLASKRFPRKARKLTKRLRYRGEKESPTNNGAPQNGSADNQHLQSLAVTSLRQLLVPYFAAASAELHDTEALHAFRIQSKAVRYAMEIFAGAFDDSFRQALYPIVADLQERLGRVNDHVTAQRFLTTWRAESQAEAVQQALDAGIELEQQALDAAHQEFLTWWAPQRRDDLRSQFAHYVPLEAPSEKSESHPTAEAGA